MIALIDGDLLVHQFTSPKDVDSPESGKDGVYVFPFARTCAAIEKKIDSIVDASGCTEAIVCFSDSENFRKDVLPTYKGHRKNRKPIMMADAIEWVSNRFATRVKPGLEADDVMGILATRSPGAFVICSFDKDLLTVPGFSYNWKDDFAEVQEATELDGFIMWVTQTLTGDSSDGYPGAAGIGPKTAAKLIASPEFAEDWWGTIVEAFKGDEEEALINARCAKILHASDYDFEKKEPVLWQPTK